MYKKILLLITVFILVINGCQKKEEVEEEVKFAGKRNVKTITSKIRDINTYIEYSGKIEADQIANVSPAMSGRIEKLFVKIGELVMVDDQLVKLDETQLEQTRLQYQNAKKNFQRMKKLLANDAIDQQTFDEVETGYNTIKSSYDYMLDNIMLKAPISGIVTHIYKKKGEKFDAMMDPFLIRIVNQEKYKAKLMVSDKDINKITKGQPAIIKLDNYDEDLSGTVSFVSPEANMMSGTFPIEISMDKSNIVLRNNQFARISIIAKSSKNAVVIPQECVLESKFVFLVKDELAEKREVILGIGNEDDVEIVKGISEGEEVIISGNVGLESGDKVKIRN